MTTKYYAMVPLQHNKVLYSVGDALELNEKQAQHLILANKITACSRAATVIKELKEQLVAHTEKLQPATTDSSDKAPISSEEG